MLHSLIIPAYKAFQGGCHPHQDQYNTGESIMLDSVITTAQTRNSIVFIDSAVEDYHSLALAVVAGAEVILIEPNRNGITQITEALQGRTDK